MLEILEVFHDLFEFAVADNWTYYKRLEFYDAFPFEDYIQRSGDGISSSSFWISRIC